MKKGYIILLALFLGMIPVKSLHAEQIVRIANVDNYVMHKYLKSNGFYSRSLEDVLKNGIVESGILGIGWDNRTQIDKISLADKTIINPEQNDYALNFLGKNDKIARVIYPYKTHGWTDVYLSHLNGAKDIVLEIAGGDKGPVHQWIGSIGIERPDGTIENIPVNGMGALSKQKVPALVLSSDYFYYRKHRGDLKKLLDKELEWKDGFQILAVRKTLETVPGSDGRFTVLVNPGSDINHNDTVLVRIALDKEKFSVSNPPTIIIGWKTVEEVDEGGGDQMRD